MSAAVALYSLGQARDILDEWLEESDGELTPAIQQLLEELEGQTQEKIENTALYIREQLVTADAIEAEAKRLIDRATARRKAADRLKIYLYSWMERIRVTQVKGTYCTVAIQQNPPSVRGELDEETLRGLIMVEPTMVRHAPETFTLDKRGVLEAYKAGRELPAGISIDRTSSLRIR